MITDSEIESLLALVLAGDFSTSLERCGLVLREASRRRFVVQRAALRSDGNETVRPVSITDLGWEWYRKRIGQPQSARVWI